MSVLFIVQVQVNDPEPFASYAEKAQSVPAQGKLVALDENPIAIEGNPHGSRVAIFEFEDEAAFHNWYDSPGYQELRKVRLTTTDSHSTLVHAVG
jgi:uncharacterized protein (DUF1330 family)